MEMGQPVEGIEDSIDSHAELAFVRLAEFLADDLLSYLPDPERPPALEPPRIDSLEVRVERGAVATRAEVGPQSTILVSLTGAPGGRASLRLSGGRAVPLVEGEPGRYRGRYRVSRGDRCQAPWVLLRDALGASSARPLGLSFDLRPPRPPRELQAELEEGEVCLSWSEPYRSEVPLGRFVVYAQEEGGDVVEVRRSSASEVRVPARRGVVRYLVAALSAAGVLGRTAAVPAPALAIPAGGS